MGPNISVSMHDLVWHFPPLKLSLRNENDAYGNMHQCDSRRKSSTYDTKLYAIVRSLEH